MGFKLFHLCKSAAIIQSEMPVCKYETFKQCPYEKTHLVTRDKLFTHLTKCRKQHLKKYADPLIIICPYKSTHHVARHEMPYHLENCDGKDLVTHVLLATSSSLNQKTNERRYFTSALVRNRERSDTHWEYDQIREPYDPATAILEKEVIRKPVGLTKSERKVFCRDERERRRLLA